MKYWEIIYYTGREDYETKSVIINNDEYKKLQNMPKDVDLVMLNGRPSFKRSLIASINEATNIVLDYQNQGLQIGLSEPKNETLKIGNNGGLS